MNKVKRTTTVPKRSNEKALLKKTDLNKATRHGVPKAFPEINERFRNWMYGHRHTFVSVAELFSTPEIRVTPSVIKSVFYGNTTPSHFLIMRWKIKGGVSYNFIYEGKP